MPAGCVGGNGELGSAGEGAFGRREDESRFGDGVGDWRSGFIWVSWIGRGPRKSLSGRVTCPVSAPSGLKGRKGGMRPERKTESSWTRPGGAGQVSMKSTTNSV